MSESKHTPGPWRWEIDGTMSGRGPVILSEEKYDDGSPRQLAELETSETNHGAKRARWRRQPDADEIEANARLIAAAPDLLAACKAVEHQLRTGESSDGDERDVRWCALHLRAVIALAEPTEAAP